MMALIYVIRIIHANQNANIAKKHVLKCLTILDNTDAKLHAILARKNAKYFEFARNNALYH